jgi:hypothetical protein
MHDQHRLLRQPGDGAEADGDAVGRHLVEALELRKGREVVLPGLLRQSDDARTAVARRARRVEGDMAVGRAARHEEEVDAAGVRQPRIVFRGIGGIGNPDVMVGDAGFGGQLPVDRRLDFPKGEAKTAVVRVQGRSHETALAV